MAEEHEEKTAVSIAISVMLLGSIGFQMLMFYLVNWPDRDIRKYSWQVISQTISIFCAVLLFQAVNGAVEKHIIEGGSEMWEVGVDMTQLVVWLTMMQIVLAVTSGSLDEWFGEMSMEKVELNCKSFAVLFSHLTGFAAINAWGSLQQTVFKESPETAIMVVPLGLMGLWTMYKGYGVFRNYVAFSDGSGVDEFEKKWIEETSESENDVAGLALSFLTVQALRFKIGGVLPNQEGAEEDKEEARSHGGWQWETLVSLSVLFFFGAIIVLFIEECLHARLHEQHKKEAHSKSPSHASLSEHGEEEEEEEEEEEDEPWYIRMVEIANNYFTFAFAWCIFFGSKWFLLSVKFTDEEALIAVTLALGLSALAFAFIFLLDRLMDKEVFGKNAETADKAAEKMITALGILIGFSWEQSFDSAVDIIAEGQEAILDPSVTKFALSSVLVLLVFPAWRYFILPTEQDLIQQQTSVFKMKLKAAADFHQEFFLNPEHDEQFLDSAHLQLKEWRRKAFKLKDPKKYAGKKLTHLRVTQAGIVEVEEEDYGKHHAHHAKASHLDESELEQALLFADHGSMPHKS